MASLQGCPTPLVCSNLRDLLGVGVSDVLALQLCRGNAPSAAKAPRSSSKYPAAFQPGPGWCRASPWASPRRQQLLPERGRSVLEPGITPCRAFPLWSCCLGRQRWPGMLPCPHPVGTRPPAPSWGLSRPRGCPLSMGSDAFERSPDPAPWELVSEGLCNPCLLSPALETRGRFG